MTDATAQIPGKSGICITTLESPDPLSMMSRFSTSSESTRIDDAGEAHRALVGALTQAAPAPSWQPIETAPMDGTAILVMRDIWPGTDTGRADECNGHNTYVAAWWGKEGSDGLGRWVCYMDSICDPECPVEPTHWMPLPQPPK